MKYFIFLLLFSSSAYAQKFNIAIAKHRENYKADFLKDQNSPLKENDLQHLHFFDADRNYQIKANVFLKNTMIKNPVSDDICSDPEVVKKYNEDPAVLKEATLNFYVEFLVNGTSHAIDHLEDYQYPCIILQGEEDKIVPKEIAENLYEKISSKDKEIKVYKGLYHEILNEKLKDTILDDIVDWLDKRV